MKENFSFINLVNYYEFFYFILKTYPLTHIIMVDEELTEELFNIMSLYN